MNSVVEDSMVPVSKDERATWLFLAHGIRTLGFVIDALSGPAETSEVDLDDLSYPAEKLSRWVMSYQSSAAEHLGQWADLVVPRCACPEDSEVLMHYTPQLLLGRAGLECASQALWVMAPDESAERLSRHIRLMVVDFQEELNALKSIGDEQGVRRVGYLISKIKDQARTSMSLPTVSHVRYKDIIRESAAAMQNDPSQWEYLWRKTSAAAHGKRWISEYLYDSGSESERGIDPLLSPRPSEVTAVIMAAHTALHGAVVLYCLRAGINAAPIFRTAALSSLSVVPAQPGHERDKDLFMSQMEKHNVAWESAVEMLPLR